MISNGILQFPGTSSMTSFFSVMHDEPRFLLQLEVEECAMLLLAHFNTLTDQGKTDEVHRANLPNRIINGSPLPGIDSQERVAIARIFMEAWAWLEAHCLIAVDPQRGVSGNYFFVTRLGQTIRNEDKFKELLHTRLLRPEMLREELVSRVWPIFLRGEYDTAVFQAFKEVEVTVRQKAGFDTSHIGVDLMQKAFSPGKGPLADRSAPPGEQHSLMQLFAGAMGYFRNPVGHRVVIDDAHEAVEMILLANHLLRILASRQLNDQ
jgi:uncharacterized protein (TIGR02391 family)